MATEGYLMYQRGVPATRGPIARIPGANPAACHPGLDRCTAPEYAVVNFFQYERNAHNFFSLRTGFLNDKKAQRTGYQIRYSEETLSWTHWIGTTMRGIGMPTIMGRGVINSLYQPTSYFTSKAIRMNGLNDARFGQPYKLGYASGLRRPRVVLSHMP